ncbi:MAG: translation initiation factor IF-3 [Spirochaetaceae bacterium]|nr:translation initiation factor IF-3 [Spirochaetaceae bacterium]
MAEKDLRINEQIRVREVRLISDGGIQEILSTRNALERARDAGLDLVEVAPNANPPVVKIIDYGKYKFENEKKIRTSKQKQKSIKLKEIRMQPKIADGDLTFKSKHIAEFLGEGNKVKVTIRFRGREMAHPEIGQEVLKSVLEKLEGEYILDRSPTMEGRFMSMMLSPKGKTKPKEEERAKNAQDEDQKERS